MSISDKNVLTVGDIVSYKGKKLIVVHDNYNDCDGCVFEGSSCTEIISNQLGYNYISECNSTKFIYVNKISSEDKVNMLIIPDYILKEELCSSDICPFSNNCNNASYCIYNSILDKVKSYKYER